MPAVRRSYSPSPTVRASHHVPLFSGPSGIHLAGDYPADGPGTFHVQTPAVDHLVAQGFSPDEAELVYAASVSGLISHEEWTAAKNGHLKYNDLAGAIFARAPLAHQGLGDDPTYMDYSNTLVPPSLSEPTPMDYSNAWTYETPAGSTIQPLVLLPGSAYPTQAELTPTYSPLPGTLQVPNPGTTSAIMNNATATAQALAQLAKSGQPGVVYLKPNQNLSTLKPGTPLNAIEASLSSIPTWAIAAAAGLALFGAMGK